MHTHRERRVKQRSGRYYQSPTHVRRTEHPETGQKSISNTGIANINYIGPYTQKKTFKPNFWFIVNDCAFLAIMFPCFSNARFSNWGNGWLFFVTVKEDRNFNLCIYLNDLLPEIRMHKLSSFSLWTWQRHFWNLLDWIQPMDEEKNNNHQMIDSSFNIFCSNGDTPLVVFFACL